MEFYTIKLLFIFMVTEDNLMLATAQIVSAIITGKQYEYLNLDNMNLDRLVYNVRQSLEKEFRLEK